MNKNATRFLLCVFYLTGINTAYSMNLFNSISSFDKSKPTLGVNKIASISISNSSSVAFQPNSENLAIFFGNSDVEIWNWRFQKKIKRINIPDNTNSVLSSQKISFSPDGKMFAACHTFSSINSVVRIWETKNWTVLKDIKDETAGSGCNAVAFSPDSRQIVLIEGRRVFEKAPTVRVFDVNSWQETLSLSTVPFQPYLVRYSNDGSNLIIGGAVRNVVAWEGPERKPEFGTPPHLDGGYLTLIDLGKKEVSKTIPIPQVPNFFGALSTREKSDKVYFAGGMGIESINIKSGEQQVIRQPQTGSIRTSFEYSKNGLFSIDLVSSRDINWFRINSEDNKNIIFESKNAMNCAAISADSKLIATCEQSSVSIFEVNN